MCWILWNVKKDRFFSLFYDEYKLFDLLKFLFFVGIIGIGTYIFYALQGCMHLLNLLIECALPASDFGIWLQCYV